MEANQFVELAVRLGMRRWSVVGTRPNGIFVLRCLDTGRQEWVRIPTITDD